MTVSSYHPQVDAIQANLIAYFRLFAGLPGVTFVEEEVTWFTCPTGAPGNHILRSQISGPVPEDWLDDLFSRIGQEADQIDWLIFPGCRPADLGQRLAARGMSGGPGGTWTLADLTVLPAPPPVSPRFRVEPVTNRPQLETWRQLSGAGFECEVQIYYDAYARHGFGPEAISLHYLGYLDETPVTSATLLLAGGIVGVFDVSTPPPFRRQGFGAAITWATMHVAQQRGYPSAWIWSSPLGLNVYRKLGFVVTDFGIREHRWQKPAQP